MRTDPDAPKHKGISVLIVDTKDPGYSWTPIITSDGSHHVNATYYHDVRVPVDMLVGEENEGWKLITTQLNHERVMLAPGRAARGDARHASVDWAATHAAPDGRPCSSSLGATAARPGDRGVPGQRAAELGGRPTGSRGRTQPGGRRVGVEGLRLGRGCRMLGRELEEVVHRYGDPSDPETDELLEYLDAQSKRYLVLTFGGGVNEVQRELVAMFGLGLPRVPR